MEIFFFFVLPIAYTGLRGPDGDIDTVIALAGSWGIAIGLVICRFF